MDLFGTAGIRGPVGEQVTPELALAVGRAVGTDAAAAGVPVVVGRDGRTTGASLAAAASAGATAAGAAVERAGVLPTPALAYASRNRWGLMLTASHNPPADNGIKLFDDGAAYDPAAEQTVERRVSGSDRGPSAPWDDWGGTTRVDPLPDYRAAVCAYARAFGASPDGVRIAVDAGNGMAALAAPAVLSELGAEVVALNATVDGHFTARESKPTGESLADLRAFVADRGAAFGIGFDGDADRVVVVDGDGGVVHEDTVVAILAERYVRAFDDGARSDDTDADPVVVTTPNASARVDDRARAAGGRVERVPLGGLAGGVASARADGADVVFAAEPWKHLHPEFGGWIDGVASAAVLARLVAEEGLAALRDPVTERPYRKASVPCPDERKAAAMDRLATALPDRLGEARLDTDHGVRLDFPNNSWTLVRPSGTEPVVRIYAEGEDAGALLERVRAVVADAVESMR